VTQFTVRLDEAQPNGFAIGAFMVRQSCGRVYPSSADRRYPAIIRTKLPFACPDGRLEFGVMCIKYDPQHEAEAAMKQAAASEGADRQRLIQLALAWHELARERRGERTG